MAKDTETKIQLNDHQVLALRDALRQGAKRASKKPSLLKIQPDAPAEPSRSEGDDDGIRFVCISS